MNNSISLKTEETTAATPEITLRDRMTHNRITVDILRGAGFGRSKGSLLIQYLLTEYVESEGYLGEGGLLRTRDVLAEKLGSTPHGVTDILRKIELKQDRTGIILLRWEVPKRQDEAGNWRSDGTLFDVSPLLSIWLEVERRTLEDPALGTPARYDRIWEHTKEVLGLRVWEPTVRRNQYYDRQKKIKEQVKRVLTLVENEGCKENAEAFYTQFLKELRKQARPKIAEMPGFTE